MKIISTFIFIPTSFDRKIPFFGLNSTDVSFETNSNFILKSGNEVTLRSANEAKFDALKSDTTKYVFISELISIAAITLIRF